MDQAPHDKIHRHREIKHPLIIYDLIFLFSHKDVAADQSTLAGRRIRNHFFRMITKYLTELLRIPVIHFPDEPRKIPDRIF